MQIGPNKVVSVDYSLSVSDANDSEKSFVEKTTKDTPLVFLFGTGGLIEDFERNLAGKQVGDSFDFVVAPENGYGEHSNENIIHLPKNVFAPEGEAIDESIIYPGNRVPMSDNQGNRYMAKVVEVKDDAITMDFNHELAGKHLHFTGTIVDVREATPEEIAHGHVHGEGGHHH